MKEKPVGTRSACVPRAIWACLTVALTLPAAPVLAGEALVEEIVVTARKREEPLQDIPGSAAALSSEFIEAMGGIENLRDLTDLIVGITITETNSPFLDEPSIRAAGQSRNRASVSATGMYRNGAYFATQGLGGKNFARFDSYDLGRVEVLRGPQGALYGRNALGGAINMLSKRPGDRFDIEASFASDVSNAAGLSRYDVRIDVPLTGGFAARVAHVNETKDDGYLRDSDGAFLDDDDYQATRLALRFDADESLGVNYTFDTEDLETYPQVFSRTGTEALRGFSIDEQNYFINTPHMAESNVDNHNLTVDYHLPSGTFSSITNYRDRDVRWIEDSDHAAANVAVASTFQRGSLTETQADAWYQEFRYVANGAANLQWLVGMDLYRTNYEESIDTGFGQQFVTQMMRDVEVDQNSWAAFASMDYKLDRLPMTLSAEIRFARDKIDGSVLTVVPNLPASPVLEPSAGGGFIQTDLSAGETFTNVPFGLTASWRFDPDKMAYLKYSNSYRHGGLNLNEGQPATDPFPAVPAYDEESSDTVEVGFKSAWLDRALTVNMAGYYIWYDNFLDTATNGCNLDLCQFFDSQTGEPLGFNPDGTPIEVDPDGNDGIESETAFFIDNVGEVEAWGVEIETTARIRVNDSASMRVTLGYGRQLGRVESIDSAASSAVQLLDGARLNNLRPKQVKASVQYRQGLGIGRGIFSGLTFVASLTYSLEKGGLINLSSTNLTPLDDVSVLNTNIGLEANRWSLMVRGRNVTDAKFERWRNAETGNRLRRLNEPEAWIAEFTWRLRP